MGRANMQVSAIETLYVSLLDRLLDRFDQLSESRQRLQELLLELLAILLSAPHDGTNLSIPGAIDIGVDEGLRIVPCRQTGSFLIGSVDVPVQENLTVCPTVPLRHEVSEAT